VPGADDLARLIFVASRRGNAFMNELLEAIAFEVGLLGVATEISYDDFPDVDDAAYVVIPHEYFTTIPRAQHPGRAQLSRTVALCVEQPGTPWFEASVQYIRTTAAAVDINALGREELRRRSIPAEHFQIGYTELWDSWGGTPSDRPVDVLHLGTETPRRLHAFARYAADLWEHECRILLPAVERKTRGRGDFVTGRAKWDLLATAKIVLNLHRQPLAYFEWIRAVEAMCNGCVVVSEASRDASPLVAGEHYLSGRIETLGMLADGLLSDEHALDAMRQRAYDFVRTELPMAASATRLVDLAMSVVASRMPPAAAGRTLRQFGVAAGRQASSARTRIQALVRPAVPGTSAAEQALLYELHRTKAVQKRLVLGQIDLSRKLRQLELSSQGLAAEEAAEVTRSSAYARATPRVTVVVSLFNHAHDVGNALASVMHSSHGNVELAVLDDGSTDGSRAVVVDFVQRHPELPAILLAHHANRGLGAARNGLVQAARGELVLVLDADNELYPTAVDRLLRALDAADDDALFAYPILEVHEDETPTTLLSYQPWDVSRLRRANYIDALALLRRDRLLELGGYTNDIRLYGWEDYDLWCRAAAHGLHGVHVPQILARYARAPHSMISVTNIDDGEAAALLRERYPVLFAAPSSRRQRP
jgi:hypothetical protein